MQDTIANLIADTEDRQPRIWQDLTPLPAELKQRGIERLLVVIDPALRSQTALASRLDESLNNFQVSTYSDISPNPEAAQVAKGYEMFQRSQSQAILAIGGGSTIDTAKGIKHHAIEDGEASTESKKLPLFIAPTTAGTGSEATEFAAIYYDGVKRSIAHRALLADVAILDARLTETLPGPVAAATGLDALCQAIESIWAVGATDQSVVYAREALKLAWEHLEAAVHSPSVDVRRAMLLAAHLAGRAIHISKTTACHAISYRITTEYGVPHGCAVALTIGPMLEYNHDVSDDDCVDPRGAANVRARIDGVIEILGATSAADAGEGLRQLIKKIGCPTRLGEVGVRDAAGIDQLVAAVNLERLANNPRRLEDDSLRDLLKRIA